MDNYVKRKNISESYTARQKRGKKEESVGVREGLRARKHVREREREREGEKEGEGGEREKGREKRRKRERESEGEEKREEMRGGREVYVVYLGRRECIRAYKREHEQ